MENDRKVGNGEYVKRDISETVKNRLESVRAAKKATIKKIPRLSEAKSKTIESKD